MDEIYDSFLFSEEPPLFSDESYCSLYERDLLPPADESVHKQQELRALDELIRLLSKESRDYLLFKLQATPLCSTRRVPYSSVKNSDVKKHLRKILLLSAALIAKGDPRPLVLDTAEDLQVAKNMSIENPYETANFHKRRRQANCKSSKEDLASKLLSNLAIAYRQNCKKRAEKKRLLSIAAPEVTYSEGRRLFGCGPVQFSEAKKHHAQFGPFAETHSKLCPDNRIVGSFAKRYCGVDAAVAWKEFCLCHLEVAERVGHEFFLMQLKCYRSNNVSSIDTEEMDYANEEYKFNGGDAMLK